jgi:DNA topoisomerase-1
LNGRYGPYITDKARNAKIPKDKDPKGLTLPECQALLAAAPERGKWGRRGAKGKKAAVNKQAPVKPAAATRPMSKGKPPVKKRPAKKKA